MKTLRITITILIAFIFSNQKINAQAGTLDPTFGNGGLIISDSLTSQRNRSLIQNDGKILVYGANNSVDRFNPDGSYDESFGTNGRAYFYFDGFHYWKNSFALQNDGKILCTGQYYSLSGDVLAAVFRSNTDGSLDSSFGNNGLDTVRIDKQHYPTGIIVQEDGKIVVAGDLRRNYYDDKRTFIYRLMPDGGLDPSFGVGGIVVNHHTKGINSTALILRPDDRLVIGSSYNILDEHPSYQLESFNSNGSIDESFGINGIAIYVFGEAIPEFWSTEMRAMVLQTDGKIVCTGVSGMNEFQMALCRFNLDGTIDGSFGENGSIITPYLDIKDVENFDVTLQPDGKILTSGFAAYNTEWPLILVRYTKDGLLDTDFGDNGITTTTNSSLDLFGNNVFVLPDGKILVTGHTYPPIGGLSYMLLARYNGDNVLADNFKDVKAAQTKDAITITWQTLNESGTKSFTVERSMNASDYVSINTVPAKGVASIYNYTDKNPLDGISYYRIRENAANGTNTFSAVVKVVFNSTGVISLYPNPAKNTVTVKGLNKNTSATIRITDMNGREISKQNFTQSSTATLNIRALAQGSYFVLVEQEGKVTKLRIVKE